MQAPAPTTTRKPSAPDGLTNFDALPDSAFVTLRVVLGLTGHGSSTIYRWIQGGTFPAPVKFSEGSARWQVGELRKALADLAGKRAWAATKTGSSTSERAAA